MSGAIKQLATQYGLFLCLQCGKCVAACPMARIFDEFSYEVSPRGVIERTLSDLEILRCAEGWFCLTCDLCTNLCPAGVRFRDFVEAARRLTIKAGITEHGSFCRHCGAYLWPQHTTKYLKQTLGEAAEELLTLCPRCRRYACGEKMKALAPASRMMRIQEAQMGEGP